MDVSMTGPCPLCGGLGVVQFFDFLFELSNLLFELGNAAFHFLDERVAALGVGGQEAHVVLKGLQLAHALLIGAHQAVALAQAAVTARGLTSATRLTALAARTCATHVERFKCLVDEFAVLRVDFVVLLEGNVTDLLPTVHQVAHLLCGILAGIAGFVFMMHTGAGNATNATAAEMNAIASSIIGGTLLTGGVGSVVGTFFGVLTLSTIKSIVTTSGLRDPWWQSITTGAMLCLFILLQSVVLMRRNRAKDTTKDRGKKET